MGESNVSVQLPNGDSICASHTVNLPYSALSQAARHAHVLLHLTTNSLVSVPKLADAGYTTVFHPGKQGVTIHGTNTVSIHQRCKPVLQGWQDENGLWQLVYNSDASIMSRQTKERQHTSAAPSPAAPLQHESAANVYSLPSIFRVIRYLHAAAGFLTKDSWLKAIANGHYITWPGITLNNVQKYFPESIETEKGHMKKQRQNVRSTKIQAPQTEVNGNVELNRLLKNQVFMIKVFHAHNTMYTDQTGWLPVQSSRGN
jgi:hypothetical protein